MADVNKVKKINGKEIIADWSNIENKPDDLAKTSDIEEQIEQVRSEIPSVEGLASEEYVDDRFEELTGAAPEALDTLEELAKALGEDANFSATIIEELAKKQNQLTFDEVPTQNSTNPVTSDGVYDALFEKIGYKTGYEDSLDNYKTNLSIDIYKIVGKANNVGDFTMAPYFVIVFYNEWSNLLGQLKISVDGFFKRRYDFTTSTWSEWTPTLYTTDIIDSLTNDSTDKPLSAKQGKILNDTKVDKVDGKSLSANDFTDELKSKLDGIAENANNYTHPKMHPGSMIENFKNIYIQSEEPTNAEEGSLWIDTDEELGTLPIAEEASF